MAETFLSAYTAHTSIYETPSSFWKWSAYATISSTLKDRCYFKSGDNYLFPNTYTMFLAESSGHRKNRPVELSESLLTSEKLVSSLGYKTISGRASVQAIMDELARSETDPNTGKVVKSSAATFFAPELSASIVNDPEGLKILTDIYDYKQTYKSRLRTGPSFDLKGVVFSILCASNPDMLQGLFDQTTIRGGFLARTLLIVPNEIRPSNSLMRIDHEKLKLSKEYTLSHLRKISQLTGEFKFEEEAIREYENWYDPFRQDYTKKKELSGVVGRIHTHVLKLSMILAANELSLCVKKIHIEQAVEECLGLLPNYSIFTMNNAKSDLGKVGGAIITELLTAKDYMLSRKMIIRNQWQNIDLELMEEAVLKLEEAGFIKTHMDKQHGIMYQLTQTCVDSLK